MTLSGLRGKNVLMAFFPLAFTRVKERISVDLLSDFKREVSRLYGTLLEDRSHSSALG